MVQISDPRLLLFVVLPAWLGPGLLDCIATVAVR